MLVGGQRNGKADLMHAALATATPPSLPPSPPKGPPRALVPPSLYLLVTRFGDTVFRRLLRCRGELAGGTKGEPMERVKPAIRGVEVTSASGDP